MVSSEISDKGDHFTAHAGLVLSNPNSSRGRDYGGVDFLGTLRQICKNNASRCQPHSEKERERRSHMKFGSRRAYGNKNEDEPCRYGDEIGVRDRGEE